MTAPTAVGSGDLLGHGDISKKSPPRFRSLPKIVRLQVNSEPIRCSWNVMPILTSRACLIVCSVSRPICDNLNLGCNLGELLRREKLTQKLQLVCRHPKARRPATVKPSKVVNDLAESNVTFVVAVWHKIIEWPNVES